MSDKTSKKARRSRPSRAGRDLAREYRFDYRKSKKNRFAPGLSRDAVVVVLDSDVAKVFRDPERINSLLRATIAAMKKPRSRQLG